jgi:hypothetical protein
MLTNDAILYGQQLATQQGLLLVGMTESKNHGKDEDISITFIFNSKGTPLK